MKNATLPFPIYIDRLVELEWELHSLGWFRERTEELLTFQKDQEETRLHAELAKLDDPSDKQTAWQVVDALIDEVMPRFSRGPYLVALWALLESGMTEIADYVANAKHLKLKLEDLRTRDKLHQWERYFSDYADFSLNIDPADRRQLSELKDVRNLLAHANGRLDQDTQLCKKIKTWCNEDRGLLAGTKSLIVSAEYASAAHALVSRILTMLISRVRHQLAS